MIPNAPVASTRSNAEKKVFRLLRETPLDRGTCFHSLRLHRHPEKVSGEADFVVVMPAGVLVLEVKGGRLRQRAGGWVSIDRDGKESKPSEGPFRQAETGTYALRERLTELVGDQVLGGLTFGFAVVTPDCNLPASSVEWGPEIIIDEGRLRGATDLRDHLAQVIDYWRSRLGVPPHLQATDEELGRVIAACRPDFDALPTPRSRRADLVAAMTAATEDQYRVLDLVGVLDRVVISGGAGTGKTWIAMEAARRQSEAGHRVLMTCHARTLAAWLRSQLPSSVSVVSHGALGSIPERYDALIVDEAQDLMSESGLEVLDDVVENGIDSGRWMLFMDPQHQAGLRGSLDPHVLDLVTDRSSTDRPLPLPHNLRNTSYIVTETTLLTGALPGRPMVSGGDPVITRYVATPSDEASLVRSWLKELRQDDMEPGWITILTPDDSGHLRDRLPAAEQRRLRSLAVSGAESWPVAETTVCSVPDFKGLENDVIILADLWSLDPSEQTSLMYVAMTRARVELRVAWPESYREQLDELRLTHAQRLGTN